MKNLTREKLEQAALALGAKPPAIRQWRKRRLPDKWRIVLAEHFGVKLPTLDKGWSQ